MALQYQEHVEAGVKIQHKLVFRYLGTRVWSSVVRIIGGLFIYLFTYFGWLMGSGTVGQAVTNQLSVNMLSQDKGGHIFPSVSLM